MANDFRYALRAMVKRPLFSLAIMLTLGTCIGAVTTVFSLVDATLLKPLPYPEPDRLGQLMAFAQYQGATYTQQSQNGRTWQQFKAAASTFDLACIGGTIGVSFSSANQVSYLRQQRVSSGYFKVLGMQPKLGRE